MQQMQVYIIIFDCNIFISTICLIKHNVFCCGGCKIYSLLQMYGGCTRVNRDISDEICHVIKRIIKV